MSNNTKPVILVIQSGWVIICNQEIGNPTRIHDARVLERWGTEEGLAQIANSGPTKDTRMSAPFTGEVPTQSVLFVLDVQPNVSWAG